MVKTFQLVETFEVALAAFDRIVLTPSSFEEKSHEERGDKGTQAYMTSP